MTPELETFPALAEISGVRHGFISRVPGVDVNVDRRAALLRLDAHHATTRSLLGLGERLFITAEQIHGREVACVTAETAPLPVPGVDGLITADARVCLGIYTADCGPVYLVDPVRHVIALLHSGRRGTELNITAAAIERMQREFGSVPAEIIAQLGPCIRPPHYEVDFAATIAEQCRAAGLSKIHDCGTCTGENVARYYSYRREQGKTGRLLAFLALDGTC